MARRGAVLTNSVSTPVLEVFRGIKHGCTAVGTSVLQVPATNLSGRKGIILQNKHATATVYVGGGIPYLIEGSSSETYTDPDHDQRKLKWILSANGTNEWYLATSTGGTPSLTQVRYLFYATVGGAETLGTNGTVSSLAAEHGWGWGDGDTLGWSTVYMRTNGSTGTGNPEKRYDVVHGYYFVLTADDTANTGGIEIGPLDTVNVTCDGSVRIFCIASAAAVPVGFLEVV